MQESGADWAGLLRRPIVTSLALSAALHLLIVLMVQSRPSRPGPHTLIISARMVEASSTPRPLPSPSLPATLPSTKLKPDLPVTSQPSAPAQAPQPAAIPVPSAEPPPATPVTAPRPEPVAVPMSLPLGVDSTWYQARQVDVQPRPIGKIVPGYPDEARRQGTEGTLKLRLRIDDLGRVRDAEVVEANPPGIFDQAALEAFRNASFRPAMREGRPVRIEAFYRVDFKLEK